MMRYMMNHDLYVFNYFSVGTEYDVYRRHILTFIVVPSQYWDIISMLCSWACHFTLTCFTWLVSGVNEYVVGQRWQWVRYTQCAEMAAGLDALRGIEMSHNVAGIVTGEENLLSADMSSDLLLDYKPAPLSLQCAIFHTRVEYREHFLTKTRWKPLSS